MMSVEMRRSTPERRKAAETTTTKRAPTPTRPPLLPSGNVAPPPPLSRRVKSREVTSRYMSSSSSSSSSSSVSSPPRRYHSPIVPRTVNSSSKHKSSTMAVPTPTPQVKRCHSAERQRQRQRQGTPRPSGGGVVASAADAPAAQKMLFTSTRSLSVSFQGESFSIQVSKPRPAPVQSVRKSTPERRKAAEAATPTAARGGVNGGFDQRENSRLLDQQRWPGKSQQNANFMNRSLDCTDSVRKLNGSRNVVRSLLQNSMADVRASQDSTLSLEINKNGGSEPESEPEPVPSDNESVTSGSSSGAQEWGGGQAQRASSRAIVVPARFWQEANNRLRHQTEPQPSGNGNKATVPPKLLAPKKSGFDSPVSSPRGVVNSRLQGSPIRSAVRPASPSRLATPSVWSPLRGVSPSRARNNGVSSSLSNRFGSEPSVLSFAVEVSRGKVGENRIADAHSLRLLHNRLLQWRFANARADAALSAQTLNAEKSLYEAWGATSELRESVRAKRTELQMLKQQFKLMSILKKQMIYLEEWAVLDRVYSSSLSGANEALQASTLRLPVVVGAKTDLLNLKESICSAMDVMQAMASSICQLSPKVGHVNSLVVEVANLSAKERALLEECKDLLSMMTAMQVRESSLRTHITQQKCLPRSQQ